MLQRLIIAAIAAETRDDWSEAAQHWLRASHAAPADHRLLNNAAHALWLADQPQWALTQARRAVRLSPTAPLPWRNLGNILRDLNRFEQAELAYGRSMALEGHRQALTAWNRSQTLIGLERYDQAYCLAERRFELAAMESWRPSPAWRGWPWGMAAPPQPLHLWSEQGFGDTLQYVRWVPQLLAQGRPVQLEVERCLVRLLQRGLSWAGGDLTVRAKGSLPMPLWNDCHGSIMSLPWLLGGAPRVAGGHRHQPYLRDPAWRHRRPLPAGQAARIGLVWASGRKLDDPFMAREYWRRSLPTATLIRLLEGLSRITPTPALVNLQLGSDRSQAEAWDGPWSAELSSDADFAATADLIGSLDLVISVDTASAHLVGALGAPGWILLPWSADPRWLRRRCDSPWYPDLELWRQPTHGDWDGLVDRLLRSLPIWLQRQADTAAPRSGQGRR